jgi:hypothetical protein
MNCEEEWTVYRTRFLVRARQLTKPMVFIDALGREHSGEPGDYLVESSEGCFRITARKIFEDVYVPLAASPPLIAPVKPATLETFRPNTNRERTRPYEYREAPENVVPCSA